MFLVACFMVRCNGSDYLQAAVENNALEICTDLWVRGGSALVLRAVLIDLADTAGCPSLIAAATNLFIACSHKYSGTVQAFSRPTV